MTPRARGLLAATSAANLLQNLLFPVLAVRALGAGSEADALFMVFILPGVIMVLLANSVLNWVTPRLVRRADDDSRRVLCWSLLWVLMAGVGALCVLLWLGAHLWLDGRATADAYALAGDVFWLGLIAVLATVMSSLAQCLFVAERDVLGGEWRSLLGSSLALAAWFAVGPETLAACAALFALRAACISAALLPRMGVPRGLHAGDEDLRGILRESRLLLLAATYYKSEPFVDRLLFASAPGGAVTAFHLAQQVLAVVTMMMNRTVTAPLVAPLAEALHRHDVPRARELLRAALVRMLGVGLLVWLLFIVAGEPLLQLLFAGSAQDPAQLALSADMLAILGGFMLAVLIGQVTGQVYYCAGETRRVVVYSSLAYTLGLLMKVFALWQWGVMGLVAAVSVSWLSNVALFGAVIPAILRRVEAERGPAAAAG